MPNILSTADTLVGAGVFNRRVTIQQPVDVPDGQGGFMRTWTIVVSTWAHIEPWKGQEAWRAQQVYPTMYSRFLIRYRPSQNINVTMRIQYGQRIYNIRSVSVLAEAQTTIELLCEELQGGSAH